MALLTLLVARFSKQYLQNPRIQCLHWGPIMTLDVGVTDLTRAAMTDLLYYTISLLFVERYY